MPILESSTCFVELDQHKKAWITLSRGKSDNKNKVGSILFKVTRL